MVTAYAAAALIVATMAENKGARIPVQFGFHALWTDCSCMQWDARLRSAMLCNLWCIWDNLPNVRK